MGNEKYSYLQKWWFWLFICITFTLSFSLLVFEIVSIRAIDKGEYKIVVDYGDNVIKAVNTMTKEDVPYIKYHPTDKDNNKFIEWLKENNYSCQRNMTMPVGVYTLINTI